MKNKCNNGTRSIVLKNYYLITPLLLSFCIWSINAQADLFDWSSNEIQYLHGDGYQMPKNSSDISRSIITLSHADGWALGRNFFFMDTLISDQGEPSQVNIYGELYSYLSFSKMTGTNLSYGLFKDLSLTGGVNIGENLDASYSGTRVILYGVTVDFNLPGFKLFNVDFLRHDILDPVSTGSSWQITPVWNFPFTLAGTHWSLEGFIDFIGEKGPNYVDNILAQPQIRLDVGDFWGFSKKIYFGIEYQYWHNKYGIKGLDESLPQALLVWKY